MAYIVQVFLKYPNHSSIEDKNVTSSNVNEKIYSKNDSIEYIIKQWKPSLSALFPIGCDNQLHFFFYWVLFFLIKRNNLYSIYIVYDGKKVIHHSVVFPRFYKFTFMKKKDIQIGMIYTDTKYRNQQIASIILNKIIREHSQFFIWYLVDEYNTHSIKLALKNGFKFYSKAVNKSKYFKSYKLINT